MLRITHFANPPYFRKKVKIKYKFYPHNMQKIPRTEVRGNIKHILKLFVNPQTLMITGYLRSINATHSTCVLIES